MSASPDKQSLRNEAGKVNAFEPVVTKRSQKVLVLITKLKLVGDRHPESVLLLQGEWVQCACDGHAGSVAGGHDATEPNREIHSKPGGEANDPNAAPFRVHPLKAFPSPGLKTG